MTIIPAYGRDYTSKSKALADFYKGRDFLIASFGHPYDGKPANCNDLKGESIQIRYKGLTQITAPFIVKN